MNLLSLFPEEKPWLVIGKGPSFSKIWKLKLDDYYTIGLNHVVELLKVDVAHFIDIEVLSEHHGQNCEALLCPQHPHVNCKVSQKHIDSFLLKEPAIKNLLEANRVFIYSCTTYKNNYYNKPNNTDRPVKVRYFSSEAVFRILIRLGIKKIRSIGIDGGTEYAKEFKYLKPLINGQESFNKQFEELNPLLENIDYKAL